MLEEMNIFCKEIRKGLNHVKNPLKRAFIKELFDKVANEYGDRLISFVVFGSVARGTDTRESDIDILLILDTNECFFDRAIRLAKIINEVKRSEVAKLLESEGYSSLTEVYPLSLEEAVGFRPIYLDICLDAIIIYDKNSFFKKILYRLRNSLKNLGAIRISLSDQEWIWILKPDLEFGEEFKIDF